MHTAFYLSRNSETTTWNHQGILNVLIFINFITAITKYLSQIIEYCITTWQYMECSWKHCTSVPNRVFIVTLSFTHFQSVKVVLIVCSWQKVLYLSERTTTRLHQHGSFALFLGLTILAQSTIHKSHGVSWTCYWNELAMKAWERATQWTRQIYHHDSKCFIFTTYYHMTTFILTYMKWCSTFLSLHIWVCSSIK